MNSVFLSAVFYFVFCSTFSMGCRGLIIKWPRNTMRAVLFVLGRYQPQGAHMYSRYAYYSSYNNIGSSDLSEFRPLSWWTLRDTGWLKMKDSTLSVNCAKCIQRLIICYYYTKIGIMKRFFIQQLENRA